MSHPLPTGFVHLNAIDPTILQDVRYATSNNFVGNPIDGYLAHTIICTEPCALALRAVQQHLEGFGLGLKVFDGYRPQQAVHHFYRWGQDSGDDRMKHDYYPTLTKQEIFEGGFLARSKSAHTRGSAVDLTIVNLSDGAELPMGTIFDFFGPQSHVRYADLPAQVRANRSFFEAVMTQYGFEGYKAEWWHFTLKDEPFPDTYFDFPVM